jgi:hypothetical protein
MAATKVVSFAGILVLAGFGCGGGNLGGAPPSGATNALRIALLSYADDGTLVAASRQSVVRLDPALEEIDRTFPPFPFDPSAQQPGLEYFGVSRDGRTASIGWQNDTNPPDPPTLTAGGIIFTLGSAAIVRSDSYSAVPMAFQGLYLSPDAQRMAVVTGNQLEVGPVTGSMAPWQGKTGGFPVFTADSSALVITSSGSELAVVGASDGATRFSITPPGASLGLLYLTAVSADGTTLAVYAGQATVTTWSLTDGTPLRTLVIPADLAQEYPEAMVVSPDGHEVALSYVPGGSDALLLWNGDKLVYRRDGETDFTIAFSPDGSTLATSSRTLGVRLLRATDGTLLASRTLLASQ